MGILTDFIVATVYDAARLGESLDPSQEFNGLAGKGIDPVKLSTLYAILSNELLEPTFMTTDESFLFTASDDGPGCNWFQTN